MSERKMSDFESARGLAHYLAETVALIWMFFWLIQALDDGMLGNNPESYAELRNVFFGEAVFFFSWALRPKQKADS